MQKILMGTVRWFDGEKRHGVIELDGGEGLVLAFAPETPGGSPTLEVGEAVEVTVEMRPTLHATRVRRIFDSAQL